MKMIKSLRAVFDENLALADADTRAFRGMILDQGRTLGMTTASAASAYNGLVKGAIEAGRLEKVRRGKLRAVQNDTTVTAWAIINKETRKIEGYAPSKNKAYAAKTDTQTVRKTSELA